MTLSKETVIDQITVIEDGTILYREAIRIMEDGMQLSYTYHRISLSPGQDLTDQPEKVVAIALATWTPEVVSAYKSKVSNIQFTGPSV